MSRILITGGSRGIGRAICLRLARDALGRGQQARIVVSATGASVDLKAIVAELREAGAQALAVTGDLNNKDVPTRLVAETLDFCGGLDTVVHNAGGAIAGTLLKTSVEDWDTVFDVNCRAFFLLGKAAQPALRQSKGTLCAIASAAAERVQPFMNAYPPAKAALVMLVQQMAYEWGRYGIRVNSVSPGIILSRSSERALGNAEEQRRAGSHIPLQRVGSGEDVANVVSFVVGPDGSYVTGENIVVDGGLRHIGTEELLNGGKGEWSAQSASGGMRPKTN
jgi:glucose 1-dehydrogenase